MNICKMSLKLCFLGAMSAHGMTPQELCANLEITEEILVFENDGHSLIDIHRDKRPASGALSTKETDLKMGYVCTKGGSSAYSSDAVERIKVAYKYKWVVRNDGSLNLEYEQGSDFLGAREKNNLSNPAGQKISKIENFGPVTWVSTFHKNRHVVIRLTPTIAAKKIDKELGKFPIVIRNGVTYDGRGRLWTADLNVTGEFAGITTVHGTIKLSYQPFPGAEKIGHAIGKEIIIRKLDGLKIVIRSDKEILPGDFSGLVYGVVDEKTKSKSITSQSVSAGESWEDAFLKAPRN